MRLFPAVLFLALIAFSFAVSAQTAPTAPVVSKIYESKSISTQIPVRALTLESDVKNYLKSAYSIDPTQLRLEKKFTSNGKTYAYFDQVVGGMRVDGARSVALVEKGKLVFVKINFLKFSGLGMRPVISKDVAIEKVRAALESTRLISKPGSTSSKIPDGKNFPQMRRASERVFGTYFDISGKEREYDFSKVSADFLLGMKPDSTELIIYPNGGAVYLAYLVKLPLIPQLPAKFQYVVDAKTGNVLDFHDTLVYSNSEARDPRLYYGVSGTVSGKYWTDPFPSGIHADSPFSNDYVAAGSVQAETGDSGQYVLSGLYGPLTLTSYLTGPFVSVLNAQQPISDHSYPLNGNYPNGAVHDWSWHLEDNSHLGEESNAFYYVNKIHSYVKTLGVNEMDFQMPATVNINAYCNAYYNGIGIYFYGSGNGCESTAVIGDVIVHEYGHGIVDRVNPSYLPYWDQSGNLNEGLADYFACTVNDNPGQGEGFFQGDPEPLRICNSTDRYPEDYSPEPHSGCQILSGAMWELRTAFGKEYTDQLLINALRLGPTDYGEFLQSLLVADGRQHVDEFCSIFYDNHGIWNDECIHHTSAPIAKIEAPVKDMIYNGLSTVTLEGLVAGSISKPFESYSLAWGYGDSPSSWSTTGIVLVDGGMHEILHGELGSFDTHAVSTTGLVTVRITAYFGGEAFVVGHTLYVDKTLKEGYPLEMISNTFDGGGYTPGSFWPIVSDFNKDGNNEIILSTSGDRERILIFDVNGNSLPGWPVELPITCASSGCYVAAGNLPKPTLADLDNDGFDELLMVNIKSDNRLYAFRTDGSLMPGFPVDLTTNNPFFSVTINSNVHVHDLNHDGSKEIIVLGMQPNHIEIFDSGGNRIVEKFYVTGIGSEALYGVTFGNFDNDPDDEIAVPAFNPEDSNYYDQMIDVINMDGSSVGGNWPKPMPDWILLNLQAGDLDASGQVKLVVQNYYPNGLAVYDRNGVIAPGWPVLLDQGSNAGPIVADVLGDSNPEIISSTITNYPSISGSVFVLNANGDVLRVFSKPYNGEEWYPYSYTAPIALRTSSGSYVFDVGGQWIYGWEVSSGALLPGFPKRTRGSTYFSLAVDDLDNDGLYELVGGADYFLEPSSSDMPRVYLYVWDTEISTSGASAEWPMVQHDKMRTNAYGLALDPSPIPGFGNIWLEAESYAQIVAPMAVFDDPLASGGRFIRVQGTMQGDENASATYQFFASVQGNYRVWMRKIAPNGNSNSFYVRMDNGPEYLWDVNEGSQWAWDIVGNRNGPDPAVYSLSAGWHTMIVRNRERGTSADKILFTPNSTFVPTGMGEPQTPMPFPSPSPSPSPSPLPNLVSSVSLSSITMHVGETISIAATVSNIGAGPAADSTLVLSQPDGMFSFNTGALAPGQSYQVPSSFTCTSPNSGYEVNGEADGLQAVAETNEYDNYDIKIVNCVAVTPVPPGGNTGGSPLLTLLNIKDASSNMAAPQELQGASQTGFIGLAVQYSSLFIVLAAACATAWFFYDKRRNLKRLARKTARRRRA